jgi:hypothetical protein
VAKRKPVSKKKSEVTMEASDTITYSSGVTVKLVPLAPGLHKMIVQKTLTDFPDPEPPGDGEDRAPYIQALKDARRQRASQVGEAILELCVSVDLEAWEPTIATLERVTGPFPEDPFDRKLTFLTGYALRTAGDYDLTMVGIARLAMRRDPELAAEIENLQGEEIDLGTA